MLVVKRALLSCHDKGGLAPLAKTLDALGVELVASEGTGRFLVEHGLRVTTVEAFAGITEQLDGRVKTLHPKIHAGILARRDDPAHAKAVGSSGLIDLVVVNYYPFAEMADRPGVALPGAIEWIDIGGVALVRAAAKNFAHVAVVCDPRQYAEVSAALVTGQGRLPMALSRRLAAEAFELTSAYDSRISRYLASEVEADVVPATVRMRQRLRYGENAHQRGEWYVPHPETAWGLGTLRQLQGKELSYNNLLDADAALRCLIDFSEPTCVIVKHHAPCGAASAATPERAYQLALAGDPEAAFGGVVGMNRPLDAATAARLMEVFFEVVAAPSLDQGALEALGKRPNLRVVTVAWPETAPSGSEWRHLLGGWLRQERDAAILDADSLRVVTRRSPTERERSDLLFAWRAAKHVKSNGIVLVSESSTVGIGQGQPSRVGSVRLAIERAGARSRRAVAASDGFFPFPDSLELLGAAGVTAVIQPGGSIRDAEVIAAADEADLAMLVTGIRHFRH